MGGKALLILVTAFSVVFLLMGRNFNDITTQAVINSVDYHNETTAHNIAVSGANMAAHQIFITPTWTTGYDSLSFQGGKLNVNIVVVDSQRNIRAILAKGTYRDVESNVKVVLKPSNFSKFAYYSVNENGIYWTGGDSVYGPMHTQDYMRFSGNAWFGSKVTLLKNFDFNGYDPTFIGGYQKGVNLPLPSNSVSSIESIADQNGAKFTGHDTVYLTFDYDSIKYKYSYNGPVTSVFSETFAPNGVIYVKEGTVRLQGKVSGKYSVVASELKYLYYYHWVTKGGNIFIDDDITYESDPRDGYSNDMLGIIAQNSVKVTNNSNNNNNDINIHAAIFCLEEGFTAEEYGSRGYEGYINLLGGITQKTRGAVGQTSGGSVVDGFSKRYQYDERFLIESPPSYPNTNSFEIVSWLE